MKNSITFWLIAVLFSGLYAQTPVNPPLAQLKTEREINLRLKNDQVIANAQLTQVDEKSLTYKNDTLTIKLDRFQVFRARQGDMYYSDLPLTAEDNAQFQTYAAYIEARGDVIVDTDNVTYMGKILAETDSTLSIRTLSATYDVEKYKIVAWRRDGKSHGDVESKMSRSGGAFFLNPYDDKNRALNYSLMLIAPWAVLPQFGLGIGSNVNWPVFGGLRGSVGYLWVDLNTIGLLTQASAFLNVNVVTLGSARLYVGTSYLWRAGSFLDYSYRYTGSYRYTPVSLDFTQNSYTLHLGLKYKNFLFEAGAELPISSKDTTHKATTNIPADQLDIERSVGRVRSSYETFNRISRVYASVSLMF